MDKDAKSSQKVGLFSISLLRLAFLSVITLGMYDIYWFYRNWKALQRTDPTIKHSFWRSILAIFYCYSLFNRVLVIAKRTGYREGYRPGILAAIYIILLLVGSGWARAESLNTGANLAIMALVSLAFIPLLYVQGAINFINQKQRLPRTRTFTIGEVLIIIAGILITGLVLFAIFWPQSSTLSPELQIQADELKNKADSLYSQYENCSNSLAQRYESLDTTSQEAVDTYNADYDNCESIRVEQNKAIDEYNRLTGQ